MAISTPLVPQPDHALLATEVEPRDYFEARKKWGNESIDAGFQILPDTLLRCQRFLELESIDVVILLNITMHWWKSRDLPFPRPSAIARRLNVSIRTVERRLVVLQRRGLITRLPSERLNGRTVRRFDPSGLVNALRKYSKNNLALRRGGLVEVAGRYE